MAAMQESAQATSTLLTKPTSHLFMELSQEKKKQINQCELLAVHMPLHEQRVKC